MPTESEPPRDALEAALADVIDALTASGAVYALIGGLATGLILMKLLAYRLQDQADIEALVAANRGVLDVDWIRREWEAIFPIDDPRWCWLERQAAGGI